MDVTYEHAELGHRLIRTSQCRDVNRRGGIHRSTHLRRTVWASADEAASKSVVSRKIELRLRPRRKLCTTIQVMSSPTSTRVAFDFRQRSNVKSVIPLAIGNAHPRHEEDPSHGFGTKSIPWYFWTLHKC